MDRHGSSGRGVDQSVKTHASLMLMAYPMCSSAGC